jgi:tetratricopeptide (TPR) repeat protein
MAESAKKVFVILIYAILVLSTVLVFLQVRNFDFVNYDDASYVYENPHVLGGLSHDSIIWAFTTGYAANWHPLTWLSHILDCQLFGPDPGWMHLVNVLLHLANTLLLFTVLKKMTGALWPSAFVAAAFALHPMHVESVAWIAERKDVLSTFFLLLTLAAYIGYVKRPSVFRYIITLALFVIGLMAKPMLVTLPFVLLLLDYWPLNRFDLQPHKPAPIDDGGTILYRIIEKIPFFMLSAISSIITFFVQHSSGAVGSINIFPMQVRVANAFLSYARYVGKMFLPQNLAAFYPFDVRTIVAWQVVLCALLLVGVSLLVIRFWRTRKYLPVGWFWFVVTLVPVIGFVQVGSQAFADRYTYVPYIGLFIMIAWGLAELLSKLPYRKPVLGISAAVSLTILGICAHGQVSYWNNSIMLFSHAIEVTQNNYIAHNGRGLAYINLGRSAEAMDDIREAIRIKPDFAEAHNNLGSVYSGLGRWQEAMDAYQQAIKAKPDFARAYNNLGIAYGELGRSAQAIEAYKQAIKVDPGNAKAYNDLGIAYSELGRGAEAIEAYKQAIKVNPGDAKTYNDLGIIYSELGRWQDTIDADKQAIKIKPDFAEAYNNRGVAYGHLGRWQEAIDAYRQAIKIKPDYVEALNNLAWFIATHPEIKNRQTNEAIRFAGRACQLANYKNPSFLCTLAAAYASAGMFNDAVDTANKALKLADATNQPQLKSIIQHHLSFYTQGKPYIELPAKPLPDSHKP